MLVAGPLRLAPHVTLHPIAQLAPTLRSQLAGYDADYVITRPHGRIGSTVVDARSVALIERFREPCTIVVAILHESSAAATDPARLLADAFPILRRLIDQGYLLPADEARAGKAPCLSPGDAIGPYTVLRCVHFVDETEVYEARGQDARRCAVKLVRPDAINSMRGALDREAAILRRLNGAIAPALLAEGVFGGHDYIVTTWRAGVPVDMLAETLRRVDGASGALRCLQLCHDLATAYACMHERGVLHGDIHPGNVVVGESGEIWLIDFERGHLTEPDGTAPPTRGCVPHYSEPEYARALDEGRDPPPSTTAGEQYSLAAMLYVVLTGWHYMDFSPEESVLLQQVVSGTPTPLHARGLRDMPDVQDVLWRALSKDPADRYPSVGDFARHLGEITARRRIGAALPAASKQQRPSRTTDALDSVLHRLVDGDENAMRTERRRSSIRAGRRDRRAAAAVGTAYALYRMALCMQRSDLLYEAEVRMTRLSPGGATGSLYGGAAGVHCTRALIARALGDDRAQHAAIGAFIASADGRGHERGLGQGLWTGASGLLLGCALLLDGLPPSWAQTRALRIAGDALRDRLVPSLRQGRVSSGSHMGGRTGMAHGEAGMLYAILRWCQQTRSALPHSAESALFRLQRDVTAARSPMHAGWSEGSAGLLHLWLVAHQLLGEGAFLDAAAATARTAWRRRSASVDIRHGMSGTAYALLALYRATADTTWLLRATRLARTALSRDSQRGPGDLYTGRLGVLLLNVELESPDWARMPLFEREGWSSGPS